MSALQSFSKEELSFDNQDFWWFFLAYSFPYAADHTLEMNFDEVMETRGYTASEKLHGRAFETIISDSLPLELEYLEAEINYYLNGFNIGNISGHSNIAFLSWNELKRLSYNDKVLFLLLLPVTAITEQERDAAVPVIAELLKEIGIKEEDNVLFANCLINGLVVAGNNFETLIGIGIVSNSKYSLRNYYRYEQYEDGKDCQQRLIRLNKLIASI